MITHSRCFLDLLLLLFHTCALLSISRAAASLPLTDLTWRYSGPPPLNASSPPACAASSADCMSLVCGAAPPVSALKLSLIDTAREARMQLGRDWPFADAPPGRGQVCVSSEIIIHREMS
jgi:hypothetical protein